MLEKLPGTVAKRAKLYRVPQMIKTSSVVLICLAPDLLALLRAPMKHGWRSCRDSVPKCKCKIKSCLCLHCVFFISDQHSKLSDVQEAPNYSTGCLLCEVQDTAFQIHIVLYFHGKTKYSISLCICQLLATIKSMTHENVYTCFIN